MSKTSLSSDERSVLKREEQWGHHVFMGSQRDSAVDLNILRFLHWDVFTLAHTHTHMQQVWKAEIEDVSGEVEEQGRHVHQPCER